MSSQKLIVVLGATGQQGGSVVETFLEQPQWKVRGLTRNTASSKAKALAERGVETVSADLNDKSSLEAAFVGAQAIFIVSDYWGIFGTIASTAGPDQSESLNLQAARIEKQQLVNALDTAAQVPSLERLVLSSLQNVSKWSGGKYQHVYHFEYKAQAAEYAAEAHPELWAKTSIFQAGWYLSNYLANSVATLQKVSSTQHHQVCSKALTLLPPVVRRHRPIRQQHQQRPEAATHRHGRRCRPARQSSHRLRTR